VRTRVVLLVVILAGVLGLAALFVPVHFVPDRIDLDAGGGFLRSDGVEWMPVWRLGAPPPAGGATAGHYELLGLMLFGEICLVLSLGGCAALALLRRQGPTPA